MADVKKETMSTERLREQGVEVLRRLSTAKVSLSDASFIAAWVTDARAALRQPDTSEEGGETTDADIDAALRRGAEIGNMIVGGYTAPPVNKSPETEHVEGDVLRAGAGLDHIPEVGKKGDGLKVVAWAEVLNGEVLTVRGDGPSRHCTEPLVTLSAAQSSIQQLEAECRASMSEISLERDRADAAEALLEEARKVLEPFAKAAGYYAPEGYADEQFVVNVSTTTREGEEVEAVLRRGDYRAARVFFDSLGEKQDAE